MGNKLYRLKQDIGKFKAGELFNEHGVSFSGGVFLSFMKNHAEKLIEQDIVEEVNADDSEVLLQNQIAINMDEIIGNENNSYLLLNYRQTDINKKYLFRVNGWIDESLNEGLPIQITLDQYDEQAFLLNDIWLSLDREMLESFIAYLQIFKKGKK